MGHSEAEVRAWADRRGGMLEQLWRVVPILPTDYDDYGGRVERWGDPAEPDADCSCGCKYARFLERSGDWLVCCSPASPRFGLLTWEHQAGRGCFEPRPADEDDRDDDGDLDDYRLAELLGSNDLPVE